jgi:hypothetical protein
MPTVSFTTRLAASDKLLLLAFPARYSSSNLPSTLKAGESLTDNMPTGVTVVNASSYSSSNDIDVVLKAVEAGVSSGVYVQLDQKTYYINNFDSINSAFYGYINASKKIMGLIGRGADKTYIRVVPTAMDNTSHTVPISGTDYSSVDGAVQGKAMSTGLYFSNSNSTVPLFFSGICFQGTFQTPYTTIGNYAYNPNTPSPLPWYGWSIWAGITGSRVQFCRFQGFGFALQASPPYECGFVNTNRNNGLTWYRCDMDGRLASLIDSSQPVASGGMMWNKETLITVKDSWQHNTRRSGFATNTNTMSTNETYIADNFQVDTVADTADNFQGTGLGFNGSNVEEVIGTFTYNNCYFNVTIGAHINWALPYSTNGVPYEAPDHTVFFVNGFRTDNTSTAKNNSNYGGCLVIAVGQRPNSTGISPAWQALTDNGIEASNFFSVKDNMGKSLLPIKGANWVAGTHTPDKYYVVRY